VHARLIGSDQFADEIEQAHKRMALVLPDQVHELVHERHGLLVLPGRLDCGDADAVTKRLPGTLRLSGIEFLDLHLPFLIFVLQRSYSE